MTVEQSKAAALEQLLAGPWAPDPSDPRAPAVHLLKAEGVKPGVSDLLLPLRRGGYAGLWLELKAPGEKPNPRQREWIERMTRAGYFATWCDEWHKAAQVITDYLDGTPTIAANPRKAA
jgi:hypothetical protein